MPNTRWTSRNARSRWRLIPTIRTNPPIGNAFTPYSVSGRVIVAPFGPTNVSTRPRRVDQSVGPNPMKNFDTLMSAQREVMKCPNSWKKIANRRRTTNARTLMVVITGHANVARLRGDDVRRPVTRPCVRMEYVVEVDTSAPTAVGLAFTGLSANALWSSGQS